LNIAPKERENKQNVKSDIVGRCGPRPPGGGVFDIIKLTGTN